MFKYIILCVALLIVHTEGKWGPYGMFRWGYSVSDKDKSTGEGRTSTMRKVCELMRGGSYDTNEVKDKSVLTCYGHLSPASKKKNKDRFRDDSTEVIAQAY